jgi:putative nucleotidyltransferase with HDIG domain
LASPHFSDYREIILISFLISLDRDLGSQEMIETVSIENDTTALEKLREDFRVLLEEGRLELPILPGTAAQVMQASSDQSCDAKRLSNLIQRDQAMASHILRLANSPLYLSRVQIVSLQQAVSRLGMKKIREMALIISCESRIFQVKGFETELRALFRHSLAAGAFAQEIARMRRWNVEEAFLCGLLHDVGKPVVMQALNDLLGASAERPSRDELFGLVDEFHAMAGSRLVTDWKLPARLSETILYHHSPELATTATQTALMTQFANDLSHLSVGPRTVDEDSIRKHPTLVPLNLYPNEVDSLLARRQEVTSMVEAVA